MNKTEKIWISRENLDIIWAKRKELLDKHYADIKSLFKWRIGPYQKVMYFEIFFDRFIKEILKQDRQIDKRL